MKAGLLVLIAAAALRAAPAAADPFCDDARLLADAAGEADPFASLRSRDFRPRLLVGSCFANDAHGYTCGQTMAPAGLTRESVAQHLLSCLPGATLATERSDFATLQVVRRGRFEALVSESGTDRSHVGRLVEIIIRAVPEPPPRNGR